MVLARGPHRDTGRRAEPAGRRRRRRSRRGTSILAIVGWLVFGLVALGGTPARAAREEPPSARLETHIRAGQPLDAALRQLQRGGLQIVFTSELVRPGMRVEADPVAVEPRGVLEEILAPHGLLAEQGPAGVLVVVAADAAGERTPAIEGSVRGPAGEAVPGGATVRVLGHDVEVPVRSDGTYSIFGLKPGAHSLEAAAPGYLEQRIDGVRVSAGEPRTVVFQLNPRPSLHEEIVVRPSRLSLLHEQPDSSLSLGREEIANLPHLGGDLFRAASLLPGVTSNDVSAGFSIHGGRRDEVRIVLDGQELYDPYHLKDYDGALSIVSARSLASATLSTGSYPVTHGDRMSGVLELRTAEPATGHRTVLGLSVLDALASSSGRFAGERGAWLVDLRRGSLDLAGDAIGDEQPSFWDALGKLELTTERGVIVGHLLTAHDELEVDTEEEEGFERLENDYRSDYGWLTHRSAAGDRALVETVASWARVRTSRGGVGVEEEGSHQLRDERELEVISVSQSWDLQLGEGHGLHWGGEARRYDVVFDYRKLLEPEFEIVAPFSAPRPTEHQLQRTLRGEHLGLWMSDRVRLFDRLTAELGVRYDRHTATDDTLVSPRLNLAWRLRERSVLRAAWGHFHQSQRPYEMQVEDGEERLQPAERSEHLVVGVESILGPNRLGLTAVRLELFQRRINDPRPRFESLLEPLNFFPEIEPDRVRIAAESSRSRGVELLVRGEGGDRLDWWFAYSYARAEDRIAGVEVPRSLDQPHTLSLDVNVRLPRAWNLNAAWRYHSGWPTTPVEARLVADPEDAEGETQLTAFFGPLNSERFPVYHRLDLRMSRRWDTRRGGLTFFVDVQNVYDRENLAGFDASLDEEAGVVELEEEHWPGLFPSLGVSWEF